MRDRTYEEFMADPTGENLAIMQEREKKLKERNVFAQRISFIEDTARAHVKNQPTSIGKKRYEELEKIDESEKSEKMEQDEAEDDHVQNIDEEDPSPQAKNQINQKMTQFEIDASRAEDEKKDCGGRGLRSTY